MLTTENIKQYFKFQCTYCDENVDCQKDMGVQEKKDILLGHIATHWFKIPSDTSEQEKLDYFLGLDVYVDGHIVESPMID